MSHVGEYIANLEFRIVFVGNLLKLPYMAKVVISEIRSEIMESTSSSNVKLVIFRRIDRTLSFRSKKRLSLKEAKNYTEGLFTQTSVKMVKSGRKEF